MKYVIYIDSFFVINFFMDFLALYIVYRIKCCSIKWVRLTLGAFVGGIYACLHMVFLRKYYMLSIVLGYILICIVMTMIAYEDRKVKKIFSNVVMLYIAVIVLGGLSNILYFRFGITNILLLLAIISVLSISICDFAIRKTNCYQKCVQVWLVNNENKIMVNALLDTGNMLKEPYTGRNVCIIEENVYNRLTKEADIKSQKGYMIIPFKSLGEENGVIEAFKIEAFELIKDGSKYIKENIILGVYKGKLSSGGEYEMIINPEEIV